MRRLVIGIVVAVIATVLSGGTEAAATADTVAPVIWAATVDVASVDVRGGDQVVNVDLHLTDEGSGVAGGFMTFYWEGSHARAVLGPSHLVAGDQYDGRYRVPVTFPTYLKTGRHGLLVSVDDVAGNAASHSDLVAPLAYVDVIGDRDLEGPTFVSAQAVPATVDVSQPAEAVVEVTVTDDLAGVRSVSASLSPVLTFGSEIQSWTNEIVRGTPTEAVFVLRFPLPQYAPNVRWRLAYLEARDQVGNVRLELGPLPPALEAPLDVVSDDLVPPTLTVFSLGPPVLEPGWGSERTIVKVATEVAMADDVSGPRQWWLDLRSTDYGVVKTAVPWKPVFEFTDGSDPSGLWTVRSLCLEDVVRHVRCYSGQELRDLGYETSVDFDYTPPVVTSQVSPGPNGYGWHRTDVAMAWMAADPESGIISMDAGCAPRTVTASASITCTAENGRGMATAGTRSVRIDKIAPRIFGQSLEWSSRDWVEVGFVCSDLDSLIDTCPGSELFRAEGVHEVAGEAVDRAGNRAAAVAVARIDRTQPSSTIEEPAYGFTTSQSPVAIPLRGTATDALSGPASVKVRYTAWTPGPDYEWPAALEPTTGSTAQWEAPVPERPGRYFVDVIATDRAGNVQRIPASTTILVV